MARLGGMDESGGLAGRGERRGDLARDMAGFAHAGDDDAPRRLADRLDRARERGAESGLAGLAQRLLERGEPLAFDSQRAQRGRKGLEFRLLMVALLAPEESRCTPRTRPRARI